ncbi:type II toxin-antitoxin system RelE family toxin [Natranaeroarchaeum sulfidigenes]|uniref:Cytotoxic translational repressor of toxin-antitoxin stability system n=1 Tax=Natranaeroarchaeum sulfidigenes TaxID=2784880 RepID=A0A897MW88_9EURY|nr:type II toxin-antitoxin system RelE/ParE family toxin [Natranaeroarchaeum sulfidigenes]QSG02565.1 Cytotoxic translational repressor of toxin-antitoxin stability system [Natranaeroarchaeum sulfidigenes]
MSEYDVLLGEDASEFLSVADDKTTRVCKEKLGYLADNPYPGRGRGDKEKLPIDGRRDRFRMHISRTYTAIYTVIEDDGEVRVLEILPIDDAHKRYGF